MSDPADPPLELAERPTFTEPWQAMAFALAVQLHADGAFAWSELAAELGTRIADDPGGEYYEHWLAAVEALVVRYGIATAAELDDTTEAWHAAAAQTPHGRPILLHGTRER